VENLILYKDKPEKEFKKMLKEFNLQIVKGTDGDIIEGLYQENYICLILNKDTEEQLERVANISNEIGLRTIVYMTEDKQTHKELLGSFLVKAFAEATPKQRQRFKGLGYEIKLA
jgi:hypothetical protein